MRLVKCNCDRKKEEILMDFSRFLSGESHNQFSFWDTYTDSRVGLHLEIKNNKIIGYYEDGTRTRFGDLQKAKNHIFLILSENKRKKTCISGCVVFSPILMLWILLTLFLSYFISAEVFTSMIGFVLLFFLTFGRGVFQEQKIICDDIIDIIRK